MNLKPRSYARRLADQIVKTPADVARPARLAVYRDRAPGVGYGNSSGYASGRRYASGWTGQDRFRCG